MVEVQFLVLVRKDLCDQKLNSNTLVEKPISDEYGAVLTSKELSGFGLSYTVVVDPFATKVKRLSGAVAKIPGLDLPPFQTGDLNDLRIARDQVYGLVAPLRVISFDVKDYPLHRLAARQFNCIIANMFNREASFLDGREVDKLKRLWPTGGNISNDGGDCQVPPTSWNNGSRLCLVRQVAGRIQ